MKRILYLLLFLIIPFITRAQHCDIPMKDGAFKHQLTNLALQPDDPQKLRYAKSIFPTCLLSSQIKDMAMVFTNDYYRLEFVKIASGFNFDPGNFYDVYDAFSTFSSAIRLYDFLNHDHSNYAPPEPQPLPSNWYPAIPYPSINNYKGVTGCSLPIADSDFDLLSVSVRRQKTDSLRRSEGIKLVTENCLSMSQAMKVGSLFQLGSNRLLFMKEIFPQLYDPENYVYAAMLYPNVPYKNDWNAFCEAAVEALHSSHNPPAHSDCEVTASDFSTIKKTIDDVSVNSTRLNLAKQIVSTKKCFTTQQLRELLDLFTIESSKLELAKYSYDYCIDKDNYYQFTSAFSITSYKNDLIEFINSKK